MHQTSRVIELFDQAVANPSIPPGDIGMIAQFYAQTGNLPKLEDTLEKLTKVLPNQPEPFYDLAALKTVLGKNNEALQDLRTSLNLSAARLKTNPGARDLLAEARKDQRFDSLRNLPDFQKLVPPN
jgi:tetratricopeptide (TPR) repeat protein